MIVPWQSRALLRRDEKSGATALMVVCNGGVHGRWREIGETIPVDDRNAIHIAAKSLIDAGEPVQRDIP